MHNKYNPEQLKEEALEKSLMIDTAIDVQSALQLLIRKEIISQDELDNMREKVRAIPKYKTSLNYVQNIIKAADLYKNDPNAYLKALLEEKLKGRE